MTKRILSLGLSLLLLGGMLSLSGCSGKKGVADAAAAQPADGSAGGQNRRDFSNMTDEQKAEFEKRQQERQKQQEEAYNALSDDLKKLVDEIRAAYQNGGQKDLTEEEKAALQEKQDAVKAKIEALSDSDQALLADFLPPQLSGEGAQGGGSGGFRGGNGTKRPNGGARPDGGGTDPGTNSGMDASA